MRRVLPYYSLLYPSLSWLLQLHIILHVRVTQAFLIVILSTTLVLHIFTASKPTLFGNVSEFLIYQCLFVSVHERINRITALMNRPWVRVIRLHKHATTLDQSVRQSVRCQSWALLAFVEDSLLILGLTPVFGLSGTITNHWQFTVAILHFHSLQTLDDSNFSFTVLYFSEERKSQWWYNSV